MSASQIAAAAATSAPLPASPYGARRHSPAILSPTSASTVYSSPAPYAVKAELDDGHSSSSATALGEPERKKQKRNKPTLSCFECVERKTKVSAAFLFFQLILVTKLGVNWTSSDECHYDFPSEYGNCSNHMALPWPYTVSLLSRNSRDALSKPEQQLTNVSLCA